MQPRYKEMAAQDTRGHHTHHHLVRLEGPLVADSCLGDHDPLAMALVGLPHANVALTPGRGGGGQSWIGIVPMHLCALLAWQGVAGKT